MKKHVLRTLAVAIAILSPLTPTITAKAIEKPENIDYLELSAGATINGDSDTPLWMWINQNGRIHPNSDTQYLRLRTGKLADQNKQLDWVYGIDVTGRHGDSDTDLLWTDLYVGLSTKQFSLTIGKKAKFFGLADSLLTAGPEVYSRNAPTIPKIALATNGYVNITDRLAFNAYLAHGWMGEEQYQKNAFLHQKHLYLRYGSNDPDRGFNIFAGMQHFAVWGGTDRVTGEHQPSGLSDFFRIFAGKSGGKDAQSTDKHNALGNHLGSFDFGLQLKGQSRDWLFYTQTMFEDGSGLRFYRPGDYLIGASMVNKQENDIIRRLNVEYFDTRSNAYKDNIDNYFSNSLYQSGWSYKGFAIGHPFIRFIAGPDYRYSPQNKIRSVNASALMEFSKLVNPLLRFAYIENHGSFYKPLSKSEQHNIYAVDVTNTSELSDGWSFSQIISWDNDNHFGAGMTVSKKIF